MKTMGFSNLILINPVDHLQQKVLKTAYGAHDILHSASVYGNLSEAIQTMDLVIGTTAKNRVSRHDYHHPGDLVEVLCSKENVVNDAAIVFGCERDGLSNSEIALCDILTTVELNTSHPSMNLSQAVMIYAYELSKLALYGSTPPSANDNLTDQTKLKSEAIALLDFLEINSQPSLYQRLKDRLMSANSEDTSLLLSLSRFLKRKLNQ
jgi:tRNA/rRNA methyltransferase